MEGIGDALASVFMWGAILLCIFVPLGIWKLVDIAIWLFSHVSIGIN